jgi:serine/threonine protein phosphatase PrpC/CRP-like cAMP-binding protein
MKAIASGLTDPGVKRTQNDDHFLVDDDLGLYVVCDGLGGHAAGGTASRVAAEAVQSFFRSRRDLLLAYRKQPGESRRPAIQELMRQAVEWANAQVHSQGEAAPERRGMSTTLDALIVLPDCALLGHVGDSRIYLVRAGQTHQLTDDHKVATEMVRQGLWTEEQARTSKYRHVLSRAVGTQDFVQVDVLQVELSAGDRFVLCSDGLADYLGERADLQAHLDSARGKPDAAARALVDFARRSGGHDNITALCVCIEGAPAAPRADAAGGAAGGAAAETLDALRKTEMLGKVPLFRYLAYAELMKVLAITRLQEHGPGTLLLEEGAPSADMFILAGGSVEVLKAGQVIARRGAGEFFGEMGLLDNAPRSASVRAVERRRALAIGRKELLALFRQDGQIAVKFLWALNQEVSQRLRITSEDLATARAELRQLQARAQDVPFTLPLSQPPARA